MKLYAWAYFAVVELILSVLAALACLALLSGHAKYTVTVCLTVAVTWLAVTLLNVGELVRRLRFTNAERDAHRALARNLENER